MIAARNIVNSDHEKSILDFLAGKSVQGKFADIVKLQSQDPFYHSVMYDLPHSQLNWLMRACVDCLPSYAGIKCCPISAPFVVNVKLVTTT